MDGTHDRNGVIGNVKWRHIKVRRGLIEVCNASETNCCCSHTTELGECKICSVSRYTTWPVASRHCHKAYKNLRLPTKAQDDFKFPTPVEQRTNCRSQNVHLNDGDIAGFLVPWAADKMYSGY